MSKKSLSYILALLFLLSFSPLALAEPFFLNSETDPPVVLSIDGSGAAPGIRHVSRPSNRLLRGKVPVKHLSNLATATPELCRRRWTSGVFHSVKFSKADVYQQISVYRL
jgi:hypothetical protein